MSRRTQDISIYDEVTDNVAQVDSSGRLVTNVSNGSGANAVNVQDGGNSITIDAVSLPLPTGAATETTLATRASETTLSAINGKLVNGNDIGDVTVNNGAGAAAVNIQDGGNSITVDGTVSATVSGTITANQGTPASTANRWPVQVTDGTTLVTVDDRTNTAKGLNVLPLAQYNVTAPSLTDGQVDTLQIDSTGRLRVTVVSPTRNTIELNWQNTSIGPFVANMWRNVLTYTVPTGFQFELVNVSSLAGNLLGSSRFDAARSLGSHNVSTNVFTDGSAFVSPGFCSIVEAEVTTAIGATATTLSVTYVNQDGVAGRTGTITITASAAVGHRFAMVLQAGDIGVRDITAVNRTTASTAGVVTLFGIRTLFFIRNTSSDFSYNLVTARESIIVGEGDLIQETFTSTSTAATNRILKAVGILTPTS